MSASFYNNTALLLGIDLHHAQLPPTGITEAAYGHREDDYPYFVTIHHGWVGGNDDKRTPDVTADGEKMIRDGFKLGYVPHLPLGVSFYWSQAVEQGKIEKNSSSEPLLKMATVTSHGDALHVCIIGPLGANVDCQDDGPKLTGIVRCKCTVITSPSLKDLIFRIFDDYLKKWLIDIIVRAIDALLEKRGIPSIPRAVVRWLLKKIVPPLVDWLEDLGKWMWDKSNEPKKPEPPKKLPPKEEPPPLPDFPPDPFPPEPRKGKKEREYEWRQKWRWWNPYTWGDPPY